MLGPTNGDVRAAARSLVRSGAEVTEKSSGYVGGFATGPGLRGPSLADEFDDQDRRLGMDTYYVELDGQGASGYGGIDKVEVRHDCCIYC